MAKQPYIDFDVYIRQGEPGAAISAEQWKTAIGLQAVDGLKPSQPKKTAAGTQESTQETAAGTQESTQEKPATKAAIGKSWNKLYA